jgi:hypothetical protein
MRMEDPSDSVFPSESTVHHDNEGLAVNGSYSAVETSSIGNDPDAKNITVLDGMVFVERAYFKNWPRLRWLIRKA